MSMMEPWEMHQFPSLRLLTVHATHKEDEGMSTAIVDLKRLGADKGFEIDVTFSPPQIILPFCD